MYNHTEGVYSQRNFQNITAEFCGKLPSQSNPSDCNREADRAQEHCQNPPPAQLTHLRREHEGLHEPAHGLHVIGELPHHLHHHTVVKGGVGVHVTDLCVAILEV